MRRCQGHNCGYTYDPAKGVKRGNIPPGVAFEDLPEDWKCPLLRRQQEDVQEDRLLISQVDSTTLAPVAQDS